MIDANHAAAAHLRQLILVEDFDIETGCCRDLNGLERDVLGIEVRGRGVRKLAGQCRCTRDDDTVVGALPNAFAALVASDQGQVSQLRPAALVILEADVAIATEQGTFGDGMSSRLRVEMTEVGKVDCKMGVLARSAGKIRSSGAHGCEVNRVGVTDTNRIRHTLAVRHGEHLADLAVKVVRGETCPVDTELPCHSALGGDGVGHRCGAFRH